ncbi:MAG TPA: hypothetical protein VKZ61_15935, partial [Thermomicrobiales bacterium]|nr:hypothetical protein [Thermomicrobiales bacterium]
MNPPVLVAAFCTFLVPTALAAAADDTPLIPREHIFGNPEKASGQISPDGEHLGFLAPRDGVLNVWV